MNNYPKPREFTPEEDALVKAWVDGLTTCALAAKAIGVSGPTVRYRARRLGLTQPLAPPPRRRPAERGPMIGAGEPWVSIAHNDRGKWTLFDGAPVTRAEAADMVEAGLAVTAQKRVDGGYDLLFKRIR